MIAPPVATANIGEICKIAAQLFFILVSDRHTPGTIISSDSRIGDVVGKIIVFAHDGGSVMPQGDDACAGQRCNINQYVRFEAACIGQCIAQDQTALGISIKNLNGFSRHAGDDIARDALPSRLAGSHNLGQQHLIYGQL